MDNQTKRRGGRRFLAIAGLVALGASCTPEFEGQYADPDAQVIVDDKWNETDAHQTAISMINHMVGSAWLRDWKAANGGKKPTVVVMDVENRTDEHLDVKALTEYISNELINSGRVSFVNKQDRQKLLEELQYQQSGQVSRETAKSTGRQIGADFVLGGGISSKVATQGGRKRVTYQTNLTLTNIETFQIAWSNLKEISKEFKRSGAGW